MPSMEGIARAVDYLEKVFSVLGSVVQQQGFYLYLYTHTNHTRLCGSGDNGERGRSRCNRQDLHPSFRVLRAPRKLCPCYPACFTSTCPLNAPVGAPCSRASRCVLMYTHVERRNPSSFRLQEKVKPQQGVLLNVTVCPNHVGGE